MNLRSYTPNNLTTHRIICRGSVWVLAGLMLIGMAWIAPAAAKNKARPAAYDITNTPEALRCSKRYGEANFKTDIGDRQTAVEAIGQAFTTRETWGVEQNVSVIRNDTYPHTSFEVRYPAGSTAPAVRSRPLGGAGFFSVAGLGSGTNAACLRYLVRFPKNFQFVLGGKLPGLYGGDSPPSGGARPKHDDGFTVRLMWRKDGQGELYLYSPNMKPTSRNGGMQIGTGNWRFKRGKWTTIEIETILNAPGQTDGKTHVWINGHLVLAVKDIQFRDTTEIDIGGFMFSTFFGGKSGRFAPSTSQRLYFADMQTFGGQVLNVDQP